MAGCYAMYFNGSILKETGYLPIHHSPALKMESAVSSKIFVLVRIYMA
jgi:hypothetical protein